MVSSEFQTVTINVYPERFMIEARQPFAVIKAQFSDLQTTDTVVWSLPSSGRDNALFRIGDNFGNWKPDGDVNADGRIGLYLKTGRMFDYETDGTSFTVQLRAVQTRNGVEIDRLDKTFTLQSLENIFGPPDDVTHPGANRQYKAHRFEPTEGSHGLWYDDAGLSASVFDARNADIQALMARQGGQNAERLFYLGNDASDHVTGTNHNDIIYGRSGNNVLNGRGGNDNLIGGADNDTLYGGTGNDRLSGLQGNDTLYGVAGNDRLIGDAGADKFDLRTDLSGTNTITDFTLSDGDRIRIDTPAATETTWAAAGLAVRDSGADAHIVSASDPARIYAILEGIDHSHLADNFSTYVELY